MTNINSGGETQSVNMKLHGMLVLVSFFVFQG